MKKTVVLCSHNRAIQPETKNAIIKLGNAGAAYLEQSGSADVAMARCIALSGACRYLRESGRDVVLMVDDDMVFELEHAEALVNHARETQVAVSAMYATMLGTLAATRLATPAGERQLWATGLGLLAIPASLLFALEQRSEPFPFAGETNYGFTWSHAAQGNYWSEDYTLCRRLGGVHLLPIAIGHIKTIPLYPDESSVADIREGRLLPGDLDSKVLARIEDPKMLLHRTDAEQLPAAAVKFLHRTDAEQLPAAELK